MSEFPSGITIGDKYGPAMEISDQSEADVYFGKCVQHSMSFGNSREEAERVERMNLGYFAGYYNSETRARVEKLFRCSHPVFGTVDEGGEVAMPEKINFGSGYPKIRMEWCRETFIRMCSETSTLSGFDLTQDSNGGFVSRETDLFFNGWFLAWRGAARMYAHNVYPLGQRRDESIKEEAY